MALPILSTATVPGAGTSVVLVFTVTTAPLLPSSGDTGFTVKVNGTTATISSTAVSASTLTLNLSTTVTAGQAVNVAYSPGNVTDSASNALAAFTATAVTNSSTQTASASTLNQLVATSVANLLANSVAGYVLDPINLYTLADGSGANIIRSVNNTSGYITSTITFDVTGGYRVNTYDTSNYLVSSTFYPLVTNATQIAPVI